MNLTYQDDDKVYNTGQCCAAHMKIANTFAEAKNIAGDRNRLGELGSIFSKLVAIKDKLTPSFVKSSKLGLNMLAPVESLLYHSEQNVVIPALRKYGNIIAPIASLFGPWGKLVAVAATLARQDYVETQNAAKSLKAAAADGATLLAQYKKLAGTVPGRVIGTDTLKQILLAGILNREWLPVTEDSNKSPALRGFFDENINKAASNGIARGAVSAYDVYSKEWPDTFANNKDQQWMAPRDQYQAQLELDALDAAMAALNPNLPFSYGTTDAAAADPTAQVTATAQWYQAAKEGQMVNFTGTRQVRYGADGKYITKTVTANGGGVMCSNDVFTDPDVNTVKACYLLSSEDTPTASQATVATPTSTVTAQPVHQTIQPISAPASTVTTTPVATVTNTVPLTNDQQTMMQTLLNQLAAQGASQQQMNTALISALSSTGVDTSTPVVQQAVATDVAATHAATSAGTVVPTTAGSGLSGWLGWGLAAVGVIFALSVPRGTSTRRKPRNRARR